MPRKPAPFGSYLSKCLCGRSSLTWVRIPPFLIALDDLLPRVLKATKTKLGSTPPFPFFHIFRRKKRPSCELWKDPGTGDRYCTGVIRSQIWNTLNGGVLATLQRCFIRKDNECILQGFKTVEHHWCYTESKQRGILQRSKASKT